MHTTRPLTLARPALSVVAVVALALVASCAADPASSGRAEDPADPAASGGGSASMPTAMPVPEGRVSTRPPGSATVVGRGGEVVICLGPVAESAPPQCDGIPLEGWSWRVGGFASVGGARYGDYAVTGRFDGTTFTADDAVPLALYSPARPDDEPLPEPDTSYDADELDAIAHDLAALPGYLEAALTGDGHVTVSVVHDDGTLQRWADRSYGEGVVMVVSALVPLEGSASGGEAPTAGPPAPG